MPQLCGCANATTILSGGVNPGEPDAFPWPGPNGILPMNLRHPKPATRGTTAGCEEWLCSAGLEAFLASRAWCDGSTTVLLRYCYGIAPMWVTQLTDIAGFAKCPILGVLRDHPQGRSGALGLQTRGVPADFRLKMGQFSILIGTCPALGHSLKILRMRLL